MTWHRAGLLLLGLCVGLMTGLSQSPVVSVLLPLLFSLIAGTSGFYAVRELAKGHKGMARLDDVGKMTVWFVAPIIVFALYGAAVRTDSPLSAYLLPLRSHENAAYAALFAKASARDKVLLARLRAELARANFADTEQTAVFGAIDGRLQEQGSGDALRTQLKAIDQALATGETFLAKALERLEMPEGKTWERGSIEDISDAVGRETKAAIVRHRAMLELYSGDALGAVRAREQLLRDLDDAIKELRDLLGGRAFKTFATRWDDVSAAAVNAAVVAMIAGRLRILSDGYNPILEVLAQIQAVSPPDAQTATVRTGPPSIAYDHVLQRLPPPLPPLEDGSTPPS